MIRIRASADTMLLVEFDQQIDPSVNARVIQLSKRLSARLGTRVRDIVPAYCAIGVHFDPLRTDLSALERVISEEAAALTAVDDGRRRAGTRVYLAIEGGIQTPLLLGSRATHLVSGMGGLNGRALLAGDVLPIVSGSAPRASRRAQGLLLAAGRARLRVLPGPQAEWFTNEAMRALRGTSFRISPRSNRMGYRLEGPQLQRHRSDEPISEPVAFGSIQVPAAGQPILLMADRPTAGGYAKIASVIAADLPIAGQLAPGDFIEFDLCSRQQAAAALIARERPLLRLADAGTA